MKKRIDICTVVLFFLLLFGFAVAFFCLPDKEFSEQENRGLQTLPELTPERLASGEYADGINSYFADQFPMRDAFVGVKGFCEIVLGKGENDGVLLGRGGQLAKRFFEIRRADGTTAGETDAYDPAQLAAAANGILRVRENMEIPMAVFLTGRTLDVAGSAFLYPASFADDMAREMTGMLGTDATSPDLISFFRQKYDAGEEVYYRTDHHWTTLGAYYAYCEVMRAFGMEDQILPAEDFDRVTVSETFYGTTWSAGGMKFVRPDRMELWYYGNEDEFTVTADERVLPGGFYNTAYLEKKDQYSVFLDGTHDIVTVTKDGEERPTLILLKDSFANSVAPFLAQHFDLVLLNLSSVKSDFSDFSGLAREYEADYALLLYSYENILTAGKAASLR